MQLRCLLVDDSRHFLAAAQSVLQMQGIAVVMCTTAAEALALAAEGRPDLGVVDVMLGGDSGVELARRLHEAGCAIVMTSTHDRADIQDLLAESPALGFIPKSELSADALRRALGLPSLPDDE
jgi:DNA-binding NarL/FixJ family response regulator